MFLEEDGLSDPAEQHAEYTGGVTFAYQEASLVRGGFALSTAFPCLTCRMPSPMKSRPESSAGKEAERSAEGSRRLPWAA